jgi:hypothetical protein
VAATCSVFAAKKGGENEGPEKATRGGGGECDQSEAQRGSNAESSVKRFD